MIIIIAFFRGFMMKWQCRRETADKKDSENKASFILSLQWSLTR